MPAQYSVSVLIPAFNEQATIEHVLGQLVALDINVQQIVVVDDGSTDNTSQLVRNVADVDRRITLIQFPKNRGKTAAMAHAMDHATGDIVIIQDADLEYDPEEIGKVIEPIQADRADVVFGSRFLRRGPSGTRYSVHFAANQFLTRLSNLFTGRRLTDIETCYKAFRSEVLKPLVLTSKGFGMEVEITALVSRTQARMLEVPITYQGRSYAEGKKILLRDGIAAIGYIFYYNLFACWYPSRRRYVARVNASLRRRNAHSESE